MDILIWVIISGGAVAFTTELVGLVLDRWMDPRVVKQVITAPIAALYLWLVGISGWELLVGSLGASFIALGSIWWLNRPLQIQQVVSGRR